MHVHCRAHLALAALALLPALTSCARTGATSPAPPVPAEVAPTITFGSLIDEMIDLGTLTLFPDPPFRTYQFSSWDRSSFGPYFFNWFANSDGFANPPQPNFLQVLTPPGPDGVGRYMMAALDGPGAIVRTWTTHPFAIGGQLAVYLDGQSTPLYDGPSDQFLHDRVGLFAGDASLTSGGYTQADACYLPIPFANSLRIVWTGSLADMYFYHVQVRRYPPGTPVKTFEPSDLKTWRDSLLRTQRVLLAPDRELPPDTAMDWRPFSAVVQPDETTTLCLLRAQGAIEYLVIEIGPEDRDAALRELVLAAYFDLSLQPQIEAPLGAFFGSDPGLLPYDSLPMSVRPDGTLVCRLVIPFNNNLFLTLRNYGATPRMVSGMIVTSGRPWNNARTMQFFARWRADDGIVAGPPDIAADLPFLIARGLGRLVGVSAMLLNPTPYCTSLGGWWGEGDEKIWVDQLGTYPVIPGTGSEDFFNNSWSSNRIFSEAYCGQPLSRGPASRGHVVNHRWMLTDGVPFVQHLDYYMELEAHEPTPGFSYARTVYFYANPMVRDNSGRINPVQVLNRPDLPSDWQPVAYGEDEQYSIFFQAEDLMDGDRRSQPTELLPGRIWARDRFLQWNPDAPDRSLEFKLPIETPGEYEIRAVFARTPASGRFVLGVDGRVLRPMSELTPQAVPVPNPVDLFAPHLTLSRATSFGRVKLEAGDHTVTLTSRGADEQSDGNAIGIDFFWLIPRNE
jgi:hypothetical protein